MSKIYGISTTTPTNPEKFGGKASAVTYTPQTLTEEQQAQARANIGVESSGEAQDIADKFYPLIVDYPNLMTIGDIEQGAFTGKGLNEEGTSYHTKRLRTKGYIKVVPNTHFCIDWESVDTLFCSINLFEVADWSTGRVSYKGWLEKNTPILIPDNVNYVRVTWRKSENDGESNLSLDNLISVTTNVAPIQEVVATMTGELSNMVGKTFGTLTKKELEQGSIDSRGVNEPAEWDYHTRRLRTIGRVKIVPGYPFAVCWDSDPEKNITCYVKYFETATSEQFAQTLWATSGTVVVPPNNAEYIRITWRKEDETNISVDEVENIYFDYEGLTTKVVTLLSAGNLVDDGNYIIEGLFSRRSLNIKEVGTLTYPQAFCIYNGRYYSINGSQIAVQNAQFELINDVALNVSHGNSMHLGKAHPNYAYISGWNDNKVYVVDLDALTIAQTINLPTTGYTTVAVDDVNQIAYIFQRDSYPNTEDHYKLIAYDYANDKILSTRVLERPFAAMQGCDYVEGKIIALNGIGTAVCPNYYIVYNTSGDIIQELVLNAFATQEPEGVFVDRKTKELYMNMYASKKLYRIK